MTFINSPSPPNTSQCFRYVSFINLNVKVDDITDINVKVDDITDIRVWKETTQFRFIPSGFSMEVVCRVLLHYCIISCFLNSTLKHPTLWNTVPLYPTPWYLFFLSPQCILVSFRHLFRSTSTVVAYRYLHLIGACCRVGCQPDENRLHLIMLY